VEQARGRGGDVMAHGRTFSGSWRISGARTEKGPLPKAGNEPVTWVGVKGFRLNPTLARYVQSQFNHNKP
jgi:hypothetical protein